MDNNFNYESDNIKDDILSDLFPIREDETSGNCNSNNNYKNQNTNNIFRNFNISRLIDNDNIILIILIFILIKNKAEKKLIIALAYLLI